MIGLLTEQYAGAFPFWLSPIQIEILPIADRHNDAANALAVKLRDEYGYRVEVDDRRETLGKKIRENQLQKVPYMAILGDRDVEQGTVGLRSREQGDLGARTLDELIQLLKAEG
jgi:threonyl-tRNA synthetase